MKKIVIVCLFLMGLGKGLVPYFLQGNLRACQSQAISPAFDSSPRGTCYNETLTTMVKTYGMRATVETLRRYLNTTEGSLLAGQRCHALAHEIGNTAVRTGTAPHAILTQCIAICTPSGATESVEGMNLGCLNGAAHTWVLLNPDVRAAAAKCTGSKVTSEVQEGCFHGIGHGLSERYAGNIEAEIGECEKLPVGRARYQCAHAVFMEKQSLLTQDAIPEHPLSYCQRLSSDIAESCFEFVGYMVFIQSQSVQIALSSCENGPETIISACRERIGESLYRSAQRPQDVVACLIGTEVEEKDCLNGFFRGSVDNVNDYFGDQARASCEFLKGENQVYCYGYVEELVRVRYGK